MNKQILKHAQSRRNFLKTAAIAGVGLMTEFRVLKTAGRPFLMGLFLTAVLALLGILYALWR